MVTPRSARSSPRLVSVVVPVRNGAATIEDQLAALAGQRYDAPWEVVVADNGSTDATRAVVDGWSTRLPGLRIVDATGRACAAAARNAGARQARGDFLAFCDADDVVGPEWLASLAAAAPDFDVVTGPLDAALLNSEAIAASRPPRATGVPKSSGFLPFAPSGNVGVWGDLFVESGGFDEDYEQAEDVEWSWRVQLDAHATIGLAPGAVVSYRYRVGGRAVARQAFVRGESVVRLYHDYRARGMARLPLRQTVRTWAWVLAHVVDLRSASRRTIWIRRAAEAAGRLSGSARHRVLFL
jgi:glycosyltransferase involved in cell wall biosynthesis